MKPLTWFFALLIPVIMLVAMDQIPLVQDSITASGYSAGEVLTGIALIYTTFMCGLAVFVVR